MKQRLLLALLVLFAAAGMSKAKADVAIKIPAGETTKSVTITLSSSKNGFSTSSYPVIQDQISNLTVTSGKAIYTIAYTESSQTLSLATAYAENDIWGDISISIDGKVTSFDASTEANLLKHVTSLSFTNNGELGEIKVGGMKEALKKIDVSNNKLSTLKGISDCTQIEEINISNNSFAEFGVSGLSKLKKLNVSNNKLKELTYPETLTDLTVGTQTISAPSGTYTANGGINMKEVATTLFGIKPSDVDWDKVSFVWNKQINGGVPETGPSSDPHAVYTARKDFFLFFNDGSKVFTDGTYRCTMTYNGNTVIVEGIKINPAKFNLVIKQAKYVKVAKTQEINTTVNHGGEVTQGESLTLSTDYAGHSLSEWKLAGLDYTTTDQKEIEKEKQKDPVEVTVAGKWDNGKTVDPEIDAAFKAAQWTVTYNNVKAESGSVSVKAVKDGKETALASGDKADAGSNIVVTVKTELGYFAKVTVNKVDKTSDINDGVLTLENISENLEITVDIQKEANVKVSVVVIKDNTSSDLSNGCFVNGILKIGEKQYSNSQKENDLSIHTDVQLSFDLTKQSAQSTTAPVIVEDILLGATSLKSTINKKEVSDDIAAAISYDVTFKVPATAVTVTIKLKTLDLVSVVPEGKNNTQTYTYDGTAKKFQFATNPAGLEKEVKIGYRSTNLSDPSKFGPDAPTAAGQYTVQYSRPASGNYAAIAENKDWKLVIEKATPQITTVPTVDVNKDGVYEIKNGVAKLGSTTLSGEWKIVTKANDGTYTEVTDQKATGNDLKDPHLVWVQFVVKDTKGENANFNKAYVQTNASIQGKGTVGKVKVAVSGDLPKGVVLKMYNGAQELTSTAEVAKGSILTFKATYPENIDMGGQSNVVSPLVLATDQDNTTPIYNTLAAADFDWNTRTITFTLEDGVTDNAVYTIKGNPAYEISKAFKVDLKSIKAQYDGKTHEYSLTDITIRDQDGKTVSANTSSSTPKLDKPIIITYKDQEGNVVPKPENVGKYTVGINIPYQGKSSTYKEYKEYQNDFAAILEITEGATRVFEAPKSTLLAKNQKLSQSALVGGLVKSVTGDDDSDGIAPLAGVFEWKDKTEEAVDGKEYDVIFTPSDKNYAKATTKVKVYVSDKNLVTFAPQNGTVKVTDQNGKTYNSGDEIVKGTVLTIVATPNESFVQKSLTVNSSAFTSGSTYTVKDESVAIEAIFAVKEPTPSSVVITLPANGKGYILSHNGAKNVAFNGSYTFTVSTLADDKKNLVVKAGSDVLTPNTDGSYTVKADKDKTISVSLSTPTKLKVSVERITKNAKGNVMGKVEVKVEGLSTTDSTCYYGDEVTIVAFPESGVTFGGWSGDITSTDKLATFTVKEPMTIKPKFTGVPTGIETIEGMRIYGGEGHIFIGCDGEAKVTLISMDGRVKKVEISGDSRIETAAGVYGVIVEKGTEVLKEKVIVK